MNDEIKEILDNLEDIGFMYKRIALEDINKLLDYITNLQQENEKLLSENITIKNVRNMVDETIYKSRVEKAVEYIKEDYERNQEVIEYCSFDEFYKKLLNILNGSDE